MHFLPQAEQGLKRLEEAGFEAYAVGGCVRDLMRGKSPKDWDLTTSARPEQIQQVFAGEKQLLMGVRHGTVTVILQGCPLEITTYRADGDYSDHRHPNGVRFLRSIEADLARRDFTMNAMALHPQRGLVDPFGGRQDIRNKIIRCVGDGEKRFEEDGLRILRGVRFAGETGFSIEKQTLAAMEKKAVLLREIPGERLQTELCKLLVSPYVGRALRGCQQVLGIWLPELAAMFGCDQASPHHLYDVWEHTVQAVEIAPNQMEIRLTMLLHDIGKPSVRTFDETGRGHFAGHQEAGVAIARPILERLRFSRKITEMVYFLIGHHDQVFPEDLTGTRCLLAEIGEEKYRALLQVKKADCCAKGLDYVRVGILQKNHNILEQVLRSHPCLTVGELAIRGTDLMQMGYQGPEIGQALRWLLQQVWEKPENNTRDKLKELLECRGLYG
jgi:tRNA nucleotidyltransferase (CCA-adding enzyme)